MPFEQHSVIVIYEKLKFKICIFQCNGYDFTMVTHKKAVDYIKKHKILNLLIARRGVTST